MENMIINQVKEAKYASKKLGILTTTAKNTALAAMAEKLWDAREEILAANSKDIEAGKNKGLSSALLDRLLLTEARIQGMISSLKQIISLQDPAGKIINGFKRPNGLEIRNVKVPLGVIGIIYEARPNVTVDAMGLCLKSGNAVILRGGSEAIHSNTVLARLLSEAAYAAGIPRGAVQFIENTDRENVALLLNLHNLIDVIIPRGGKGLINYVVENSSVPIIETGAGVCHVYVDKDFQEDIATSVIINGKTSRPAVCNAIETVLIHEAIKDSYLPKLIAALKAKNVEIRGDEHLVALDPEITPASEEDWSTEYGDLILSIKVVKNLAEAVEHINRYGSHHSEAIITDDYWQGKAFQEQVDAAAVYINASTRFTDGEEFGFGGEIGISTQKLHIRGPMGLDALTTNKYLIMGEGQIR